MRYEIKLNQINDYSQDDFIKILLKSAFAKQLFGDNTAAKVMSSFDPMLQKINDLEALILN